ncbi:hypothetical protein [Duganella sacchari]|uniref:hypothetical protein n=1 Tax=Duganella sacchari TaxID=551987 RepID=UPI001114D616|nr:hypothetical protein [Duganella sacchari]
MQADGTMRHLRKMEGYTIVAVTSVDGEFQGCDFGRVIKLLNGMSYKCSSYSYTYAYSPDAIVFAKANAYQGKSLATIKLLIEGEIFDMEPVFLK